MTDQIMGHLSAVKPQRKEACMSGKWIYSKYGSHNKVIHFIPERTVVYHHTWLQEWPLSSVFRDKS